MIQLQLITNRINISPLEPKIQPAKGARRHYAGPMTSSDPISLPPVTISLVTLYNYCFLTVEDKGDKKFQELSYHTDVVRVGCLSYILHQ